jgi:hypothetical protein
VYAFWLRAMLYHPTFARIITEKDRTILMHLQEITATLHDSGYGFELTFHFEKNDFFGNETLKKSFVMLK